MVREGVKGFQVTVGRVCHHLVKGKDATTAAVRRGQSLYFHNRVVCRTLYKQEIAR